ncbi:polysaccharide export protein [Telluria mixta]|uniref:Polysaccharide export protein n=1 Tax=Telluria mixta TaxID=34071 RepID=A0ABT2C0Q5_9BURK|nr:polysaccharide biosynthesis/export family protein [Telluria mixta]MCS0630967.1 polysaccharide export protein [Telluria mixta]WEM98965.1 polysaccharide export protein [Telluria mixta]
MRFSFVMSLALVAAMSNAVAAQRTGNTQSKAKEAAVEIKAPAGAEGSMSLSPAAAMNQYGAGTQLEAMNTVEAGAPAPEKFDYSVNTKSDVFGAKLFSGSFLQQGAMQFNPDYLIAVGDQLMMRFWGGFNFEGVFTVDPKGNVFVPQVGPVQVLGVRNRDLQQVVEASVRKVFRANVAVYASLAKAQPVRVFVGGNVRRPGLYNGTSMDSLLHYLDSAGGIDTERGSFLNVVVKRGQQVRTSVNLYDFLLNGVMPMIQLGDGDVIFVEPRHHTVKVEGFAENAKRFEFVDKSITLADVMALAKPTSQATNVRIVRNSGTVRNIDYYSLSTATDVRIFDGDEVEFTSDTKPGTITVRVDGEHQSMREYVLPYGASMGMLLSQIKPSAQSDMQNIQLFRHSVQERQKELLDTSLSNLQQAVLTARSGTAEEAQLRKEEAGLMLQWVERARKITPRGQVVISRAANLNDLVLENGDTLRIPAKGSLVLVSGEVLFPNAVAYDPKWGLEDYVRVTGGLTQHADSSRIIIAHPDGSFDDSNNLSALKAGDEIMVLPKVDVKSRQIWKEVTQVIYQIAISAKVALGL